MRMRRIHLDRIHRDRAADLGMILFAAWFAVVSSQIVTAIRRVAAGDPVLSPAVVRRLIERVADDSERNDRVAAKAAARTGAARSRLALLAEREREVAWEVGQGRSNAEIARKLHLAVPTVKAHVSRILTRLDLNNRVQVALLVHDADLSDDT